MKFQKLFLLNLIFVAAGLLFTACVEQKSSSASSAPTAPTENLSPEDTAFAAAQNQISAAPEQPDGYDKLAVLYIKKARETGDFSLNSKAEATVDQALAVKSDDVPARKLKASLQLTFHRFGDALELGKKLQADFPTDPFVYGVLTDANAELGNYDAAVEAAQKMVDLRPNSNAYARVAHMRSLYGDHDGAVEAYKLAARTADPNDKEAQSWALVQLGDEMWKYGKYPEAEKIYDEALQNFPNYYLAIAGKGRVLAAQGDYDNAIKILTEALNRIPNVETAILLGDLYEKKGDTEQAKQQYDLVEVVEQKIGVNSDQKRLALMWADHDTRLDEALAIAQREHEARKDFLTADTLAWVLYKKGQFEEAKKAVDEAMRIKTNDARMLYHAGMIEKQLGNKSQAKKYLQEALKLNPMFDILQNENAKKALQELS